MEVETHALLRAVLAGLSADVIEARFARQQELVPEAVSLDACRPDGELDFPCG